MRTTILFLFLALIVVAIIVALLRSRRISEKYAILWLGVGVIAIVLAAFPALLGYVARLVGVQVASNLLFALALILLLGVCIHLSLEVTRLEDRVRRLAEESALLRHALENPPGDETSGASEE